MADIDFELHPDSSSSDPGTGFLAGSIARAHLSGALEIGPLADDEDDSTGLNLCDPPTTDQC